MNLEQEPHLFRQWLGTENGKNDLTKYLTVVDRPLTRSGDNATLRDVVTPDVASLRLSRPLGTAPYRAHRSPSTPFGKI